MILYSLNSLKGLCSLPPVRSLRPLDPAMVGSFMKALSEQDKLKLFILIKSNYLNSC